MLKFGILLIFIIFNYSFSQKILWEEDYKLNTALDVELSPCIIDKDNNVINLVGNNSNFIFFLKYDTTGKLSSFQQNFLLPPHLFVPLSFYETESGYRVLAGTSNDIEWISDKDKILPMIFDLDKDGQIMDTTFPYDIYDKNNYSAYFIEKEMFCLNTLSYKNRFFNVFIYDKVWIDSLKYRVQDNIVFTCLDTNGKILFRNGFDTLSSIDEHYIVRSFLKANDGKFIILVEYFNKDGIEITDSKIIIFEVDEEGNLLKIIELSEENNDVFPRSIIQFTNGEYCILGVYQNINDNEYFVWKINSDGEILKKVRIKHKYIKNSLNKIYLNNEEDILIIGRVLFDIKDTSNILDDLYRFYIMKMDLNLNFEWDFDWYVDSFGNSSYITQLLFLNDKESIIIGRKGPKNYYISKIMTDSVTNVNDTEFSGKNILIYPNPVSDLTRFEITNDIGFEFNELNISICNIFGQRIENPIIDYEKKSVNTATLIWNTAIVADGIYLIRIIQGTKTWTLKVILNK